MKQDPESVSESVLIHYRVCDRLVQASVDSSLAETLGALYPDYRQDGAPHREVGRPAVRVAASPGGYVVEGPEGTTHCPDTAHALGAYEHALTMSFLEALSETVQVHASGAVVDGKAVLALGPAGAGKTSVALALVTAGCATLGDDVVLLDRERRAVPFRRLFKVHVKTLETLGVEPAGTPFWDPAEPEAWYDPVLDAGWAEPAPVGLLLLPRFRQGAALQVQELGRARALDVLMHSALEGSGVGRSETFEIMADVAEEARAYRMTFGADVNVAEAVLSLMP